MTQDNLFDPPDSPSPRSITGMITRRMLYEISERRRLASEYQKRVAHMRQLERINNNLKLWNEE